MKIVLNSNTERIGCLSIDASRLIKIMQKQYHELCKYYMGYEQNKEGALSKTRTFIHQMI